MAAQVRTGVSFAQVIGKLCFSPATDAGKAIEKVVEGRNCSYEIEALHFVSWRDESRLFFNRYENILLDAVTGYAHQILGLVSGSLRGEV